MTYNNAISITNRILENTNDGDARRIKIIRNAFLNCLQLREHSKVPTEGGLLKDKKSTQRRKITGGCRRLPNTYKQVYYMTGVGMQEQNKMLRRSVEFLAKHSMDCVKRSLIPMTDRDHYIANC